MAGITVATLEERVNNYIKFFWTVVAFGFVWLTGLTVFMLHINDTLNRIETTQTSKLGGINQSIEQIRRDLSPLQINAQASLPNDSFQAELPKLKAALATAKKAQLPVSPYVLTEVQSKLLSTNKDNPAFWPTVSEFVSYRSQINVADFQSLLHPDLPNCTDHDPLPMKVIEEGTHQRPPKVSPAYYDDCRFTLDSPQDNAKVNYLLVNTVGWITFRHCLIVYRGGQINLIVAFNQRPSKIAEVGHPEHSMDVTWIAQTLHFDNCLFSFDFSGSPALEGQKFTQTLLAGNISAVELPLGKS